MEAFLNLAIDNPYRFLIYCILIGGSIGLIIRFFEAILEFVLSFRVVQFAIIACVLVFVVKGLV